ncbi:ABC transporter permease [Microbacterium sp. ASV49]|uniref:Autoinducer 2 import system permease protein LsrD n=1 Tax=Microbacterium candidum TaxID=3041922 RepID=A0ABT7MW37_9MICO|nr:ABC transporter permease [Microbacterium sp. ASV49]MDL9978670.1 ABC transporter permease [Microbacterium sp. ASV49]
MDVKTETATRTAASAKDAKTEAPPSRGALHRAGGFLSQNVIVVICILLFAFMSIASPVFLSPMNVTNLLDQWASVGIIACAGTFVLISRMFDLSVGAIYALSGVVAATIANATGVAWMGFAAGIATGIVVGLINGIAVAVVNINPFIATLATSLMLAGIAVAISGGLLVSVTDPAFTALGQGVVLGLTIPGAAFVVIFFIAWFVLARTVYGRRVYAVGGSPEAARLSGIGVRLVHTSVFVLSGLAASIAGVLAASKIGAGQADVGANLPLIVIAVVVVGGTSIFGGEGAMWRTALGVLLYAMIGNGFSLLNVNTTIQQIVQGSILLVAVGLDAWSKRRRG